MLSRLLKCHPSAPARRLCPLLQPAFVIIPAWVLNPEQPCPTLWALVATCAALSQVTLCVKTALSLYPISLLFSPPSDVFPCPRTAQACQAAFLDVPGGLSPHCQLLQFQTQLFSSVLRQMESLITFYRLGRVQNAIDSQCLSFTAASPAQTLTLHSAQVQEGAQHYQTWSSSPGIELLLRTADLLHPCLS